MALFEADVSIAACIERKLLVGSRVRDVDIGVQSAHSNSCRCFHQVEAQ
jgi:hypothetical protein